MKKAEKGMTLIELMISIAVFAIVVSSSAFVLTVAHQMSQESRGRLLALNTARSIVETIKDTSLSELGLLNLTAFLSPALPGGAVTMTTNPSPIGASPIATVTVTVTWTGPKNMPKQVQVTTMRSRYG